MLPLYGEYECSVDEKGRLKLPAVLLKKIGDSAAGQFSINRGFEKCLSLYPEKVWEEVIEKINNLNTFVTEQRNFVRYFIRGLKEVSMDSAERVLLPKPLMEYAGIQKEIIIVGYRDYVEIWDKATYMEFLDMGPANYDDLTERYMGRGPFDAILNSFGH
jgi:MraZ protein